MNSMRSVRQALIGLALVGASLTAVSAEITGRVVGVSDGDTISVLVDGHESVKVRLVGIDAPEKAQAYGAVSKRNLSDQVFGKSVSVEWEKKDKYGRILGRVLVNGTDVCLEQIKNGLAWHYKQYARDQAENLRSAYAAAEQQARLEKIGLWSMPSPTPLWEFRHSEKPHVNR
ncbi:MAG: thermonuclease family protein [Rhodoferax sp.]